MTVQANPSLQTNQINPQDFPGLLDQVEKDLMRHIIDNMKNKRMHLEDAKRLAKEFLALLPISDKGDLLDKLNVLSLKYGPAKEIYVKFNGSEEEVKRQKLLSQMRDHIKSGNIEQAIAVAKGA